MFEHWYPFHTKRQKGPELVLKRSNSWHETTYAGLKKLHRSNFETGLWGDSEPGKNRCNFGVKGRKNLDWSKLNE